MAKTVRLPKDGPALTKLQSVPAALAAQEAFNKELTQSLRGLPIKTHAPRNPTGTGAKEGIRDEFLRSDSVTKQGIVTIKGDLLGHSTVPERVPVGSTGQVLAADPTTAVGLKYVDPSAIVDAVRAFLSHLPRIPKAQAGSGITIVEDALGPIISASGTGAPDDGSTIEAHRAFLSHIPRDRQVHAGANVTVTEDALGYIVASTGGGAAVDDMNNILANQVFGG